MGRELDRLGLKLDAGADYVMTQPVFRPEALDVLDKYRQKAPVLMGVMVLTSLEHARRFSEVPGVVVPEDVFERLGRFEDKADQAKEGLDMAVGLAQIALTGGWSGLYLMSPATHGPVLRILGGLGR